VEEEREVRSGFEALARSLGPVERLVLEEQTRQSIVRVGVSNNHFLEKVKNMIVTHKRLSAATAATLTALAASLVLYVSLFSASGSAYALEQTAQANQGIKTCHVKFTGSGQGMTEAWVQMNPDGTPFRARMDFPKTEDGAKVVILSADKAEVWFKDKNNHLFITEKGALTQVLKLQQQFDPKLAFEAIQKEKESGKVQVSTKEPAKAGEPITLTVTANDKSDRREVCEVDPNTKLVERVTTYHRHGDQWEQMQLIEYLDYNKEIDPKVFDLDLPKDVTTIDQINQQLGLEKGDLTKEEIATKVAKEFFEALIVEDYKKAGSLYEGIPAEKMKEMFGRFKFYGIVEIGEAASGMHPDLSALKVPVKVEWEMNDTKLVKPFSATVRITDAEKAVKAVRDFYEAVIKQDETTAYQIFQEAGIVQEGLTADEVKKLKETLEHEHVKFLRIVEVGKPVPHSENGTTEVPLKIELEATAGKQTREFSPYVRPVYGHPDRWGICGGI
jgi:outer membrane lipoprotein-sorting protein